MYALDCQLGGAEVWASWLAILLDYWTYCFAIFILYKVHTVTEFGMAFTFWTTEF